MELTACQQLRNGPSGDRPGGLFCFCVSARAAPKQPLPHLRRESALYILAAVAEAERMLPPPVRIIGNRRHGAMLERSIGGIEHVADGEGVADSNVAGTASSVMRCDAKPHRPTYDQSCKISAGTGLRRHSE